MENRIIKISVLLFSLFLVCSCVGMSGRNGAKNSNNSDNNELSILDSSRIVENELITTAKLLSIKECNGYKQIDVINPWDTTQLLHRYILVSKNAQLPHNLPNGTLVRTPVERVVVYTAVDVGSLDALGLSDKIVGACEASYIVIPNVKADIKSGKIVDLGSYANPNIEKLISVKPEMIFVSPFSGKDYGLIEKLNIGIGECASYMESEPLGRCEWIKFYAAFFEKELSADSIYNSICQKYNKTVELIKSKVKTRPTIIADKRYGQVWYVAPGNSFVAKLYKDAGANYYWADTKSKNALALSFETVFQKAHDADVWLFCYYKEGTDMTLEELKQENETYSAFKAFKQNTVYGCNTLKVPFHEMSSLRPDLVLLDMAKMLHSDLFSDYQFSFYKKLNAK